MYNMYFKNCNRFNKGGKYIPGSKTNVCVPKIQSEDPAKKDRENREQVVDEIRKLYR